MGEEEEERKKGQVLLLPVQQSSSLPGALLRAGEVTAGSPLPVAGSIVLLIVVLRYFLPFLGARGWNRVELRTDGAG